VNDPPPVSPIPIDLRAFRLNPTNYSDVPPASFHTSPSIPNLESISSLSEEPFLYPTTPLSSGIGGEYFHLCRAPHWSNYLLDRVNFQDYYFLAREEAFILSGESGEPEAILSAEGNSSESRPEASHGGEEVLVEEAGGTWSGVGAGGV